MFSKFILWLAIIFFISMANGQETYRADLAHVKIIRNVSAFELPNRDNINIVINDSVILAENNGKVIAQGNMYNDVFAVIQSALNYSDSLGGGKLILGKGVYSVKKSEYLSLPNNTTIEGAKNYTIFRNLSVIINSKSNVVLKNIAFVGYMGSAVLITKGTNNVLLDNLTSGIHASSLGSFCQFASDGVINDTRFINCSVKDSNSFGFLNTGHGGKTLIKNSEYVNCIAIQCGIKNRSNNWVTGFDIAENCNVENISLINCEADKNWESGFHIEDGAIKKNIIMINCRSTNNGRIKANPVYGSGFLVSSGMKLVDCASSNNNLGYRIVNNRASPTFIYNCTDNNSDHSLLFQGEVGNVFLDNFTSKNSKLESIIMQGANSNITAEGLYIIDQKGNHKDKVCARFGNKTSSIRNSKFDIHVFNGDQPILISCQHASNLTFGGYVI